jgi:hypothetical protein
MTSDQLNHDEAPSKRMLLAVFVSITVVSAGCFGIGGGADETPTGTVGTQTEVTTTVSETGDTPKPPSEPPSSATIPSERPSATTQSSRQPTDKNTSTNDESRPTTETGRLQFSIGETENCGRTCRTVTATLTNTGSHPVSDIVIESTVLAGDSRIWRERRSIDALGAGESTTTTTRIDIGLLEGAAIESNNGYVTIKTVIISENGQRVITTRRNVT